MSKAARILERHSLASFHTQTLAPDRILSNFVEIPRTAFLHCSYSYSDFASTCSLIQICIVPPATSGIGGDQADHQTTWNKRLSGSQSWPLTRCILWPNRECWITS